MGRTLILLTVIAATLVVASGVSVAVVTKLSGDAISKVRVAQGSDATSTTSPSFVDLPGAFVRISVPAGEQGLILARFSAESECYTSGTSQRWCSLRILAVKDETNEQTFLQPDSDFAFDSANNGIEDDGSWESHSVDRSVVLRPGTYTVKVQYRTTNADSTFRLDDWHLTVEKARAP